MSPRKTILASSLAALLGAGALLGAPAVHAYSTLGSVWSQIAYPESLSDNAASDSQGFFCALCHLTEAGNGDNPYGAALRPLISRDSTQAQILAAFASIEALNSDGDPTGASNIAEINADAQPGWKVGDAVPQVLVGNLLDPLDVAPDIAVAPPEINFGEVDLGTSATGGEVTITNTGNEILTVSSLTFSGDPVFSLGQSTPATPFNIAPDGAQVVGVVYTPNAAGMDIGALEIASNDPDTPVASVDLVGEGVASTAECAPSVVPTSLAFGEVLVTNSLELPVTLTNNGQGSCNVDVSVPTCIDGEFLLTSPASFDLPAGESSIVTVSYTPVNEGQDQCRIDIGTQGNDLTVPMSGTGVLTLPTDLDITAFRATPKVRLSSGNPVSMSITIKNRGTEQGRGVLTVTGLQNGVEFVHQVLSVFDPVGGRATTIRLQFYLPTATGLINWTATLQDGDPDLDVKTTTTLVK